MTKSCVVLYGIETVNIHTILLRLLVHICMCQKGSSTCLLKERPRNLSPSSLLPGPSFSCKSPISESSPVLGSACQTNQSSKQDQTRKLHVMQGVTWARKCLKYLDISWSGFIRTYSSQFPSTRARFSCLVSDLHALAASKAASSASQRGQKKLRRPVKWNSTGDRTGMDRLADRILPFWINQLNPTNAYFQIFPDFSRLRSSSDSSCDPQGQLEFMCWLWGVPEVGVCCGCSFQNQHIMMTQDFLNLPHFAHVPTQKGPSLCAVHPSLARIGLGGNKELVNNWELLELEPLLLKVRTYHTDNHTYTYHTSLIKIMIYVEENTRWKNDEKCVGSHRISNASSPGPVQICLICSRLCRIKALRQFPRLSPPILALMTRHGGSLWANWWRKVCGIEKQGKFMVNVC